MNNDSQQETQSYAIPILQRTTTEGETYGSSLHDKNRPSQSYAESSLLQEQNLEYEKAMIQDIENRFTEMERAELKQLKEDSWNQEQLLKASRLLPQETGAYSIRISFRYHLKNGLMKRIEHGFPLSATLANVFDFIECKTFLPVGSTVHVFIPFPRTELKPSLQTLQERFGCATRALALHVDVDMDEEEESNV